MSDKKEVLLTKEEVIDGLRDIVEGIGNRMIYPGEMTEKDQELFNLISKNLNTIVTDMKSDDFCKS